MNVKQLEALLLRDVYMQLALDILADVGSNGDKVLPIEAVVSREVVQLRIEVL